MTKTRRSAGFLATAKALSAHDGQHEPSEDALRTAASRAYSAVFHKLSEVIADDLAGAGGDPEKSDHAWREFYRMPEHGKTANACRKAMADKIPFPPEILKVAVDLPLLQTSREAADYDPEGEPSLVETHTLVAMAERAVAYLGSVRKRDRVAFEAWILVPPGRVELARRRAAAKSTSLFFGMDLKDLQTDGSPDGEGDDE